MALAETFDDEVAKRIIISGPADRVTRALADNAIGTIYSRMGRLPPPVIWCESLYQMAVLPSLLIGLLHSDLWQVACTVLDETPHGEAWEEQYEEAWRGLWSHGGYQLFKGIRSTSRLGSQFEHLETGLLKQTKEELRNCFFYGKLKRFEQNLVKQAIYRQFWAPHLWQPINFFFERWYQMTGELEEALLREEHSNDRAGSQFSFYKAKLRRMYGATGTSLSSLIGTLGAEPAGQFARAVFLPTATAMASVAKMWMDHVNESAFLHLRDETLAWHKLSENAFAVVGLDDLAIACDKPTVFLLDEGGRLHSPDAPAVRFQDGFSAYFWHGVPVEARIIEHPGLITIEEIENAGNVELRRVLVERYGQPRYLHDSGAQQVHEDEFGVLYRKDLPDDEPLVMVKVVNSTAEPDGTFKEYFLRVPPWVQTARDAVGWTFGFDADSYGPRQET